jgi:hypothetical protein
MQNAIIDTGPGFSAHAKIEDLEKLGWEFTHDYQEQADAKSESGTASYEEVKKEERNTKENYHIRLYNRGKGIKYIYSHNESGDTGEARPSGDDEKTKEDVQTLLQEGKLWEVFQKDPYYGYEDEEE